MTGYETILAEALRRMRASPALAAAASIRRAHRTTVPRDKVPAIHVIDGPDRPDDGRGECRSRICSFSISVFVRSDEGVKATDDLRNAVAARMAAAWSAGITVTPGAIVPDTEIGDEDPARLDFEFQAVYRVAGEFSLELPT